MAEAISIKPSEATEGSAVPVDRNLRVAEARFALFDYQGKAPPTTAAKVTLVDDDNVESIQHYSVGDPSRFVPSQDGKTVIPVGTATTLAKSCNFMILMDNMVSAGFPENKLGADITAIEGLYAYWIGVPEPKRSGLSRTEEQAKKAESRVICVPSQIHNLPGEKKGAAKVKPKAGAAVVAPVDTEGKSVTDMAVEFIGKVVDETGSATRQVIATRVFTDLAADPNRDAIAQAVFAPESMGALLGAGFTIDGENITR